MSRELNLLNPRLLEKYVSFEREMNKAKIPFIVTCTGRSIVEQMALYVQGRMDIKSVNRFRFMAGLTSIIDIDNRKVTWTLNSKHIINMFDDDLNNDYSNAFDIALLRYDRRSAHWDLKTSVNDNEIPDYMEAGKIGEHCGLEWGGRWRKKDYVHFQDSEV